MTTHADGAEPLPLYDEPAQSSLRFDTLSLIVERSTSNGQDYFRVNLQQSRVIFLAGIPQPQTKAFGIPATRVYQLRQSYDEQVQLMHQWAERGIDRLPPNVQQIRDLGQHVTDLLPVSIQQGISAAVRRARKEQRGLRIVLLVDAQAQAALAVPWELMLLPHDHEQEEATLRQNDFLLWDAHITLVRQVRGIGRNTPPHLARPLHIQAFAATPAAASAIDLTTTSAALQEVLPTRMFDHCWYAGNGTLKQMQQRLIATNPTVVHLVCHGYQGTTGRGKRHDLLLTLDDGFVHRVNAHDLAAVLSLAPGVQVVVLQACHAGASLHGMLPSGDDVSEQQTVVHEEMQRIATEGIALTLIRLGIPVVVAMQGAVGQAAAGDFVRAFYTTLRQGSTLEQAVAAGRIQMGVGGSVVDWSLPVIYQGSGQPEPDTWFTRLADGFNVTILDPVFGRSVRAYLIVAALILLSASIYRWLAGVPGIPPSQESIRMHLVYWDIMGVLIPMIVGLVYRGTRNRDDLPPMVRQNATYGKWTGAFVNGILGITVSAGLFSLAWSTGVLEYLPWLIYPLVGISLVGLLGMSYAGARAQEQFAIANTPVHADLYGRSSLIVIVGAMLVVSIGAPWFLFFAVYPSLSFLLTPASSGLIVSLLLLMAVLIIR